MKREEVSDEEAADLWRDARAELFIRDRAFARSGVNFNEGPLRDAVSVALYGVLLGERVRVEG